MAQVTCKVCKNKVEKSEAISVKSRVYCCKGCEEEYHRLQDEKNQPKELDSMEVERRELISYICDLHNTTKPDIIWLTQMKRLHNDGMRYKGMQLSLEYYINILGNQYDPQYGVQWIIEKYYQETFEFYKDLLARKKAIESAEDEDVVVIKANTNKLKVDQFKAKIKGVLE
ncbi:MAG: hypothetical protein ACRCX8_14380 [Sarcina sp.]